MMVMFYYRPIQSGKDESGIPVFKDVVFVQITMDPLTTVDRQAEENDFERFPDHYAHFKKANAAYEPIVDKIPLEMWPVATPADISNLKGRGIRTVEQLAALSKNDTAKWPAQFASLADVAKTYMKVAGKGNKEAAAYEVLVSANADLQETVALLKAKIALLQEQIKKAEDA